MKKIFTLMGGVVALCWPHDTTAAPLAPKTLGELLGIRETPAQTFASGAPAATTGTRHQGQLALKSEALAPQIHASIVYPSNILGMWAYELNEWKPTQLSIDRGILATGGGFEAKGYYYFTRYQQAMGFEEIKTVSYDTSTWQAYDEFTGQIDYVATTIAYSEARDEAYGCFINADRNGYNFVKWDYSLCESGGAAAAAAPTDVKALAAADGVLAVDVSWTLPTVDTDGQPLEGDRAIEKVVVYRDSEPAATLPADTNSWRDNADSGLVPGNHSYEVAVSVAGQEGLKSEKAESGYVGPFTYAPLGMQGWTTYKTSTLGFTGPFTGQKPAGYLDSYTIWSLDETEVDTWLSSPELPLSADKNYKIGFQYQKWAEMKAKSLKVYLSPVPAAAEHVAVISALTPIYELADITGTDTKWTEVLLREVPGNGAYVIFHVSGTYQKRLTISAFSVEEDSSVPFVPASPMDLKAAVSGLSVQLTWTNPTESVSGDVFTEEQSIEAVVVQRDGEEIARLEGGETEFIDNKDSGLVAGTHSYAVSVVVAGVESALSDAVEVSCIDPSVPVELPWQSDFNNNRDEFTSLWNSHAAEGHSPLLGLWYHHNAGQIAFMNNNGYGENAWLVGPLVSFDTAAEYTVTFDAIDSAGKESVLRFGLVESPGSSEFLHVIEENLEFPATSGKTEVKFTFIPVTTYNSISGTPANMHIALQAASTGVGHRVFLYSMDVDKKEITLGVNRTVDLETDMLVSVEVYDLSGRRLGTASSVALDGYDAGLYIVKLNYSESSPRTLKIAK